MKSLTHSPAFSRQIRLVFNTALLAFLFPLTGFGGVVTYTYDPSLGTMPDAQGWTLQNSGGASSLSGGVLNLDTTASNAIFHGWILNTAPFSWSDHVVMEATIRINSSTFLANPRRSGYYFGIADDSTFPVWTGISGSNIHYLYHGENYSPLIGFNFLDGNFHDIRAELSQTGFDLFIDNNLVLSEGFVSGPSTLQNEIRFGDWSNGARSDTDLAFFKVTIGTIPEPTSMMVVLPLACVAAIRRRVRARV